MLFNESIPQTTKFNFQSRVARLSKRKIMPDATAAQDYSIHAVAKEAISSYVGDFDVQKNRRRNYRALQINIATPRNEAQLVVQVCDYLAPPNSKTVNTSQLYVIQTEEKEENPIGLLDEEAMLETMANHVVENIGCDGTAWISLQKQGLWFDLNQYPAQYQRSLYGLVRIRAIGSGFPDAEMSKLRGKLRDYLRVVSCSVA